MEIFVFVSECCATRLQTTASLCNSDNSYADYESAQEFICRCCTSTDCTVEGKERANKPWMDSCFWWVQALGRFLFFCWMVLLPCCWPISPRTFPVARSDNNHCILLLRPCSYFWSRFHQRLLESLDIFWTFETAPMHSTTCNFSCKLWSVCFLVCAAAPVVESATHRSLLAMTEQSSVCKSSGFWIRMRQRSLC